MTIICVLVLGGRTFIGSDRQATINGDRRVSTGPKWSHCTGSKLAAVGTTGDVRLLNTVCEAGLELLEPETPRNFWTTLVAAIAQRGGELKPEKPDDAFPGVDASFIWVRNGQIYDIDHCGGITPIHQGYWARGSGAEFALGCLFGLAATDSDGLTRVTAAVCAASFNIGCGGEPWVEEL